MTRKDVSRCGRAGGVQQRPFQACSAPPTRAVSPDRGGSGCRSAHGSRTADLADYIVPYMYMTMQGWRIHLVVPRWMPSRCPASLHLRMEAMSQAQHGFLQWRKSNLKLKGTCNIARGRVLPSTAQRQGHVTSAASC